MIVRPVTFSLLSVGGLAGKCTQEMAVSWLDNSSFSSDIQQCAAEAFGNGKHVGPCLKSKYPVLSDDCAACFGDIVDCGRIHCIQECADVSEECISCTERAGCNSQLASCTGFQGPPITTMAKPSGVSSICSPVALLTIGIVGIISYTL